MINCPPEQGLERKLRVLSQAPGAAPIGKPAPDELCGSGYGLDYARATFVGAPTSQPHPALDPGFVCQLTACMPRIGNQHAPRPEARAAIMGGSAESQIGHPHDMR